MSKFINGLSFIVCFSLAALAAQPAAAAADKAEDKPPAEVMTLAKKWMEAKQLGDTKVIGSYLSDTFIGVGPLGTAEDKRAFVERLANSKLQVTELAGREQSVRSYGDVVVITGIYQVKGSTGDRDLSGTYRYVDVVRKANNPDNVLWVVITSTLTKVVTPAAKEQAK